MNSVVPQSKPPVGEVPNSIKLRSRSETVAQDWKALSGYLSDRGMTLNNHPEPRQFASGFANLNYLLYIDDQPAVLRRPPMGPLPPGAYDMGRESKILANLWQAFPLAPKNLHYCADSKVLGAAFQITEFRPGLSIRDQLPGQLANDPDIGAQLGDMLIRVLVQLHQVDPATVGLTDLGRPDGFLQRAVAGWIKRAKLAVDGWGSEAMHSNIEKISRWLETHKIPEGRITLLHNDFKLDNILLDPDNLSPVAVVDWDQGTRGDGLFDLATLLSYWVEPDDPPALQAMRQMPTARPGFMTRREAAEAYARLSGIDLGEFSFYRVLATFKTAIIFAQLYARYHAGGTQDPRYAEFETVTQGLLEFALAIAHNEKF